MPDGKIESLFEVKSLTQGRLAIIQYEVSGFDLRVRNSVVMSHDLARAIAGELVEHTARAPDASAPELLPDDAAAAAVEKVLATVSPGHRASVRTILEGVARDRAAAGGGGEA